MKQPEIDQKWMRHALRLARRGWGRTSPNPMVGAIIVRHNTLVAKGAHLRAGEPHAEVHAIQKAAGAARGSTLYVTLEPCSTTGRTPACTDAILKAGVKRVVVGSKDPNPSHAGRGITILRDAGIAVEVGVLEAECLQLNEAFFCWIQHGRPFVLLKMAMTLDGKIATASGESKWVTGPAARRSVQKLRQWADAIMVGGETVRTDNPSLTVREPRDWAKQPLKLVWTRRGAVPAGFKVHANVSQPPRCVRPQSLPEWQELLGQLGDEQVTSLLIEGGGELAAACLRAGVVDKIAFFVAPKILGGRGSRPVVGGEDPLKLAEALDVEQLKVRHVGNDILMTGYLTDVHRPD